MATDPSVMQAMLASQPGANPAPGNGMVMTDPGSMDAFQNNQALIQQLGKSSANPEKLAALKQQQAMAEYLRNGPAQAQGHYIPGMHGAGVYVGPSALNTLASGAQYAMGAKMGMNALKDQQSMASDEAKNRTAVMAMMNEQFNRPPMYSPDASSMPDAQNVPNYNFDTQDTSSSPNVNNVPKKTPPRQMTPDEFAALQYNQ